MFRGLAQSEDLARGNDDMAMQPLGSNSMLTSASSARARLRSITMLPKPFLRLILTLGPSCSCQSSSTEPSSALSTLRSR